MIVRVLTARVPGRHAGQFNELLRAQLVELHTQPGLAYVKLARRLDERGDEEVLLFEEWATPADLWAWTGGRLHVPRLLPGTEELVEGLVITHYEALDMPLEGEMSIPPEPFVVRRRPGEPPPGDPAG